jgi:hypothetical protein
MCTRTEAEAVTCHLRLRSGLAHTFPVWKDEQELPSLDSLSHQPSHPLGLTSPYFQIHWWDKYIPSMAASLDMNFV